MTKLRPSLTFIGALLSAAAGWIVVVTLVSIYPAKPGPQSALPKAPSVTVASDALIAKAAIIYDAKTRSVLFSKNSNTALPLASLTKLMTAEVVLANGTPNRVVTITPDDLTPDGDWGFKVGDLVNLGDLLRFGLVVSSNDAIAAAAASLGTQYIQTMNSTAKELGLTNTHFLNPTGLDVNEDTSGAYGSAYDVAKLTALFFKDHPAYFEVTQAPSASIVDGDRTLEAKATALPLLDIGGFIGAKTGYTDLAGGNLSAVFDLEPGHPIVAVVLGSTEDGRFSDIKTLVAATRASL